MKRQPKPFKRTNRPTKAEKWYNLRWDQTRDWRRERSARLAEEVHARFRVDREVVARDLARNTKDLNEEHADLFRSSQVALWMMFEQLLHLFGPTALRRMLGFDLTVFLELSNPQKEIRPLVARAVWVAWSLFFCPEQLRSSFHIQTWGYFIKREDLEVKRFEDARIRRGYGSADFADDGLPVALGKPHYPGVIVYRSMVDGEVVDMEGVESVKRFGGPRSRHGNPLSEPELRTIFAR